MSRKNKGWGLGEQHHQAVQAEGDIAVRGAPYSRAQQVAELLLSFFLADTHFKHSEQILLFALQSPYCGQILRK